MLAGKDPYLSIVKDWEEGFWLIGWDAFTPFLLSRASQRFPLSLDQWEAMSKRLLQLEWSGQLPALEAALQNFARIAQDLVTVFRRHAVMSEKDDYIVRARVWTTEDFYRPFIAHRDSSAAEKARHRQAFAEYRRHVDDVRDLTLELTRAANLVIDRVREGLNTAYRDEKGHVAIGYRPGAELYPAERDFSLKTAVVAYSREERDRVNPYPGLEEFLVQRVHRDLHFGGSEDVEVE